MLKRTLFFSNPFYLSLENCQIKIKSKNDSIVKSVPIEDVAYMVIDHPQISLSMPLIEQLSANNVAVIFCSKEHLPTSMLLNLDGNNLQSELFRAQIKASEPLKKNLWRQTIEAKIKNQAAHLHKRGIECKDIKTLATKVKSGDADNREAVAARQYWSRLVGKGFRRERYGDAPNHILNYGYSLLRSAVARALSGSGLLATLGIHHHNKYNAFCLADDIMEPYRVYVDQIAMNIYGDFPNERQLNKDMKISLLSLMACDVNINNTKRPLTIALSITTASLARCFNGESRQVIYPNFM